MALKRLAVPHDVVGISEIDKQALKSYELLHGETRNYGDISKVDKLGYADVWTYSFPCQSISNNGRKEGFKKGTSTKSSLLWEVERLLDKAIETREQPSYLVMENVKNLVGKKFMGDFEQWQSRLEERGYNNYWTVTNALEHGVAQKRERVIMVSVLKKVDKGFKFVKRETTRKRIVDYLEGDTKGVVRQLDARIVVEEKPQMVRVRKYEVDTKGLVELLRKAKQKKGLSNRGLAEELNLPMTCVEHWFRTDKYQSVPDPNIWFALKELLGIVDDTYDKSIKEYEEREGVFEQSKRVYDAGGVAPTLTTNCKGMRFCVGFVERNLTVRECWRMMGFSDADIDKVEGNVPEGSLYRQAGNSIVVGVMEDVFKGIIENERKRGEVQNDNDKRVV